MYEIYLITNQINEKVYVGQTKQGLTERWRQHVSHSSSDGHTLLDRAINKYGNKFFTICTIVSEIKSWKEANRLEMLWIKRLRSANKNVGYNMTVGGEGVRDPTGEVRRRISATNKRRLADPKNHPKYRHDITVDKLLPLYANGFSDREIARQVGVSYGLVYNRLKEAGARKSKEPMPSPEDVRHLYQDENHSLAGIASVLNISQSTAWRYLQDLGISTSLGGTDKDEDIVRLYNDEMYTTKEVASILEISPSMVKKHLRKLGVATRPSGSTPRAHLATERVCPQCNLSLLLNSDNFRRNRSNPNGWSYWCKPCTKQHGRRYRLTAKLKKEATTGLLLSV